MDISLITLAAYREFIIKTGYVTQAERFGDAGIFHDSMRVTSWRKLEISIGAR